MTTYILRIYSESIQPHRMADSAIVSDPFIGVFHAKTRCRKPKLKRCWGQRGAAQSYVNPDEKA